MLLVIVLLLVGGCVKLYGVDGSELSINKGDAGFFVEKSVEQPVKNNVLKALVKGSVYESGEIVSVFGTCLDEHDRPVGGNGTFALLSAWYPNGTQYLSNYSMQEIQDGYYLYTGPMNVVGGTYLTQIECVLRDNHSVTAKAFGEWQNPAWVRRIRNVSLQVNDIQQNISDLQQDVKNITVTIGNVSFEMNRSFEITWEKLDMINATINETYNNLSDQIYIVGQIANSSVDRNDSYIAQLLQQLSDNFHVGNWSGRHVNFTEDADPVVFWRKWNIRVDAFDPETGDRLSYPDVICDIYTSLSQSWVRMSDEGNHFVYSEFINRLQPFTWNVSCYWA